MNTALKICYKCKKELPLVSFKKHSKRKDGLQADCISCQQIYRKQHYLNNKDKYKSKAKLHRQVLHKLNKEKLKELKNTLSCSKCTENHPACLDFHHLDSSKKEYSVSQMMALPWETIEKEIAKCIVFCSNCHRKHHYDERNL